MCLVYVFVCMFVEAMGNSYIFFSSCTLCIAYKLFSKSHTGEKKLSVMVWCSDSDAKLLGFQSWHYHLLAV